MSNLNPFGVDTSIGRTQPLGPTGDIVTDVSNNFIGSTGVSAANGIQGATGIQNSLQGTTGIGIQGVTGMQGITGVMGLTGALGSDGVTGLHGVTGIGPQGSTGLTGATGIRGVTGLVGPQGFTGLQGVTGAPGNVGSTGLMGATGITGVTGLILQGLTGLQGATGVLGSTGLWGTTGVQVFGLTGLQGSTGIMGATGLLDLITIDVQQQTSGATLIFPLPANQLGTDSQHLEFYCSGLTATDASASTITITLGNYTLFTDIGSFAGGADFTITGIIIRLANAVQETSTQIVYESGRCYAQWQSINAELDTPVNLIVSIGSAGVGHVLYTLVVRLLRNPRI